MDAIWNLILQDAALRIAFVSTVAVLAGVTSMVVYRWVSPQARLRQLQRDIKASQQKMTDYDGEFAGLWALIQENLKLALKQVGWSLGPSLCAGVPLLLVGFSLDQVHRQTVDWAPGDGDPVAVVSIPDMMGTVADHSAVDDAAPGVQRTRRHSELEYLPLGPPWMRSWLFLFVLSSTAAAIVMRTLQGAI